MSAIKAGDWVMVVRAAECCGSTKALGITFKVNYIGNYERPVSCGACKVVKPSKYFALNEAGIPICPSRLIKIDPPALPETINEKLEITA